MKWLALSNIRSYESTRNKNQTAPLTDVKRAKKNLWFLLQNSSCLWSFIFMMTWSYYMQSWLKTRTKRQLHEKKLLLYSVIMILQVRLLGKFSQGSSDLCLYTIWMASCFELLGSSITERMVFSISSCARLASAVSALRIITLLFRPVMPVWFDLQCLFTVGCWLHVCVWMLYSHGFVKFMYWFPPYNRRWLADIGVSEALLLPVGFGVVASVFVHAKERMFSSYNSLLWS